jgi:hypothetical protein
MFQQDAVVIQKNKVRAEKWAYLTEGIKDAYTKTVTEILLDNEEAAISYLNEESSTGNIATFQTFAFPLIRKVFPESILNQIVSVQPMTQPAAKIFFLDFTYGTAPLAGGSVATYNAQAKDYSVAGDPYAQTPTNKYGEGVLPKEINWQMSSDIVEALTRKLRAVWTIEAQQDLKAVHGLEAEAELTTVMAEEIKREVEGDVLWDMCDKAGTGIEWNATPSGNPDYINQKAYASKIYEAILDAANEIYKKRYVYPNWIVTDPDTCTRLEKLENFRVSDIGTDRFSIGRSYFGTLNNKFDIYKDPWMPLAIDTQSKNYVGRMLMGFRGGSWFQTGYVYSPYVPILITPVLMDPNDFKPRRGIMTRYGKKAVVPDCFATLDIYTPIP